MLGKANLDINLKELIKLKNGKSKKKKKKEKSWLMLLMGEIRFN